MSIASSSVKIAGLSRQLMLLSVAEKCVRNLVAPGATRQLHSLVNPPNVKNDPHGRQNLKLLIPSPLSIPQSDYSTGFFVKHTAEQLWKGVTSVSNAGRKRGRGRGVGKKTAKDLNRGQIIGIGKTNIVWPGLNAPVLQGKELVERRELPTDPDREAKLIKMRDSMGQFRPLLLSPLERGWSGTKMHGRSVGPPDPIGEDNFEGFDTKILEMKTVANMDANYGRIRRFSVFAFTGNKQGMAGFALAKAPDGRGALKRARNRAGQKLLYIERYKEHTVLHDFYTRFGATQIYVYKKPEGFGLVCHRAIKAMCELIGIKDVYAKVKGSTNLQHIVKAFMLGLIRQKSHSQFAEEKELYLVEQREDFQNFPVVIGEPSHCKSESEIKYDEPMNFSEIAFGNRIPYRKRPFIPGYRRLPSWENHLLKTEWRRNHGELRRWHIREFDGLKSHLTIKHPEADGTYAMQLWKKKKAEEAEKEED